MNPRLVDPASRKIVAILGIGAVLSGGVEIGRKRYKLTIRYYDDESTPARISELAERLIKEDGVKLMLGPYSSGLTQAMPLSSSRSTRCRWWRGTPQRASSSQKPIATSSPCPRHRINISSMRSS